MGQAGEIISGWAFIMQTPVPLFAPHFVNAYNILQTLLLCNTCCNTPPNTEAEETETETEKEKETETETGTDT